MRKLVALIALIALLVSIVLILLAPTTADVEWQEFLEWEVKQIELGRY
jgi:hypothetical protein